MKKFLLISPLILGLTLTGCVQKINQDDLFEKKMDCASYKNDMEIDIEKLGYKDYIIQDIFYSPSLNSCLYKFNSAKEQFVLVDFFSKQIIGTACITFDVNDDKKCFSDQEKLFDKIKQLKGE